ncbi:uncharacterized protein V6R79_011977 [Siganus canaliculatus]
MRSNDDESGAAGVGVVKAEVTGGQRDRKSKTDWSQGPERQKEQDRLESRSRETERARPTGVKVQRDRKSKTDWSQGPRRTFHF